MESNRKKSQSNKMLLSQLDEFDQDIVTGNTASESQENTVVKKITKDRDFTVDTSINKLVVDENTVNVKTMEMCFNERIDREMSKIVGTAEDRTQNAILITLLLLKLN